MRPLVFLATLAVGSAGLGAAAVQGASDAERWLLDPALDRGWADTPELRAAARDAAAMMRGAQALEARGATRLFGVGGLHVGELSWICDEWPGRDECRLHNEVPLPTTTCAAVPAHWSLALWAGNSLRGRVEGQGVLLAWTENHVGLLPGLWGAGSYAGTWCARDLGALVIVQGDGVFQLTPPSGGS